MGRQAKRSCYFLITLSSPRPWKIVSKPALDQSEFAGWTGSAPIHEAGWSPKEFPSLWLQERGDCQASRPGRDGRANGNVATPSGAADGVEQLPGHLLACTCARELRQATKGRPFPSFSSRRFTGSCRAIGRRPNLAFGDCVQNFYGRTNLYMGAYGRIDRSFSKGPGQSAGWLVGRQGAHHHHQREQPFPVGLRQRGLDVQRQQVGVKGNGGVHGGVAAGLISRASVNLRPGLAARRRQRRHKPLRLRLISKDFPPLVPAIHHMLNRHVAWVHLATKLQKCH